MAPISKCLLLALLVVALAQCVEPRSRPTNNSTVGRGREQWISARVAALAAGRFRRPQRLMRPRNEYHLHDRTPVHYLVRSRRPQRLMRPRACIAVNQLLHGESSCNNRGCNLTCDSGFEFGNTVGGGRTLALRCDATTGALLVEGRRWTSGTTLCTAVVCATPCQNGGTCVASNRCACPGAYTGQTCSEIINVGDQPYKNYYPGPLISNQRRVECEPGTRMPDGSTSVTLSFRDNSWFYPDGSMMIGAHQVNCVKDNALSDAAAPSALLHPDEHSRFQRLTGPQTLAVLRTECGTPCLNKGVCEPNGTCRCRPGYAGHKCEQRVCRQPRFENDINATVRGNVQRMTFLCRPGYVSPRGDPGVSVVCEGGSWQLEGGKVLTEDAVKCTKA